MEASNGSFSPQTASNAFKRDVPNAEIHFVPSGHFALESHHTEIARLMKEFLGRVLKFNIFVYNRQFLEEFV